MVRSATEKEAKVKIYKSKTYVSAHPADPALLQALLIQLVAKASKPEEPKRRRRRGRK